MSVSRGQSVQALTNGTDSRTNPPWAASRISHETTSSALLQPQKTDNNSIAAGCTLSASARSHFHITATTTCFTKRKMTGNEQRTSVRYEASREIVSRFGGCNELGIYRGQRQAKGAISTYVCLLSLLSAPIRVLLTTGYSVMSTSATARPPLFHATTSFGRVSSSPRRPTKSSLHQPAPRPTPSSPLARSAMVNVSYPHPSTSPNAPSANRDRRRLRLKRQHSRGGRCSTSAQVSARSGPHWRKVVVGL